MRTRTLAILIGTILGTCRAGEAADAASLCLAPFPKEVRLEAGAFSLARSLTLETRPEDGEALAKLLVEELSLLPAKPRVRRLKAAKPALRLSARRPKAMRELPLREGAGNEDYALEVRPDGVTICAEGTEGLFHGAQTLRQLIRANRRPEGLPCLTIRDWPSLRWRAFQDDLTRGPSSTLANLKLQAGLGAFFKLNIFTYYMEYQYAFARHPVIGPTNGSLAPAELKALVDYARLLHLNVLGNQQSFGHFTAILAHPQYARLRETDYLLCPTHEETYGLLDDLYSEVLPLLPFGFFNVCCDETDGLGQGPSKPVAEQLGVGGLYVRHIRRLHGLVTGKYGKRMMMWGDIILRHPEHLKSVPKDVVMLSWGYDPRPNFEDQILPFAQSGYDFFVCPGVNCWNRVLPHFSAAAVNIRNFVRDGAKHGASGVLNTAWDDDGENFNAPNWHGIAWGAECAWNAAVTPLADFNRRLGAVLFGETSGHFGKAIDSLGKSGIDGLPNRDFWQIKFAALQTPSVAAQRDKWRSILLPVREAVAALQAAQQQALVNRELLPFFEFGARRMELYAQRELDRLEAAVAYRDALKAQAEQAAALVEQARQSLWRSREAYAALARQFTALWQMENKPYALDWTLRRYQDALTKYDEVLQRLDQAKAAVAGSRPLPSPREVGLELVETEASAGSN